MHNHYDARRLTTALTIEPRNTLGKTSCASPPFHGLPVKSVSAGAAIVGVDANNRLEKRQVSAFVLKAAAGEATKAVGMAVVVVLLLLAVRGV